MSHRPLVAAFALLCLSAAPALAAAASDLDACRIVAPRYEPKAAHSPQTQPTRWPGGAKLLQPIAEPCPPSRRPADA